MGKYNILNKFFIPKKHINLRRILFKAFIRTDFTVYYILTTSFLRKLYLKIK
jgi:hypothetical protein